ncbi:MAG: carbohydrate-binding domain-containing protein [Acetatifactor sp.]|nr:carbohydrate-binding domain-containing protein [Acetatifactor sp.]
MKKTYSIKKMLLPLLSAAFLLSGCAGTAVNAENEEKVTDTYAGDSSEITVEENNSDSETTNIADVVLEDLFTDRDMEQEADTEGATQISLVSGENVDIVEGGVYVISGEAIDTTIAVDVNDEKVQLVLDGVNVTNSDSQVIYVKSADKVFITTAASTENNMLVTGEFAEDDENTADAVIYSKDDCTFNGLGTLNITSSKGEGISGKDDLKFTGGTYFIKSENDSIEANDSICIAGGSFDIESGKDGIHSENDEDDTVGNVYIGGGTFVINASDDGIQATTSTVIDGGDLDIKASEGIEGTNVIINGGNIRIEASDDGINASEKSSLLEAQVVINGGDITINMASGDTDGVDTNGSIYINGGKINITGNSAFDYDVEGKINGGTVIVNGEEITEMTYQMFGPGDGIEGFFDERGNGDFSEGFSGEFPENGDAERPEIFGGKRPEDFQDRSGEMSEEPAWNDTL